MRILKSLMVMMGGLSAILIFSSCGSTSTTSGSSGGGSSASCVSGSNDFYVVENASCAADSGKLSRINPDVPCKEEILTSLDCPTDFVMGSGSIGYLSLRTNNSATEATGQPGEIYAVDVTTGVATQINKNFNKVFTSPAGLAIIEDLTQAERDRFCGGNTVVQMIIMVADEGIVDGAGTVWTWCVNTDDYDESLTPIAALSTGADGGDNFRGVAVLDRETLFVTADASDGSSGVVLQKDIDSVSQATVVATVFTTSIKDIMLDTDGSPVVADPEEGTISKLNVSDATRDFVSIAGGVRDAIRFGTHANGNPQYLVTRFDEGDVILTTILDDDTTPSTVTTDLTLSGPDGISQ